MLKSELVARLAARNGQLCLRDAEKAVDTLLGSITDALAKGQRVEIRDFGSFSVKDRRPRQGRNPRTGVRVAVAEKKVVVFRPGKKIRLRLRSMPVRARPELCRSG